LSDDNKLSGRVIGGVRVLGLLNTAIERLDGVDINATAFSTGLLDTYGSAAAAYSVRRLSSSYTGACMRVREDGTNTETDIGFNSAGHVDVLAIRDHCGSNSGFIRYWYDQSGNAVDAGQATETSQPQIYNGTTVFSQNGKPRIEFASGKKLLMTYSTGGTSAVFYSVQANPTTSCIPFLASGTFPAPYLQRWIDNDTATVVYRNVGTPSTYADGTLLSSPTLDDIYEAIAANNQALLLTFCDTSTMNGLSFEINHAGATSMQEFVTWDSGQQSNRTGIETNVNGYFKIF